MRKIMAKQNTIGKDYAPLPPDKFCTQSVDKIVCKIVDAYQDP